MKKLMIAAAAAALIGGAEAGLAQVYNYKMTVKTTTCKDNKSAITDVGGNTYRYYRAQTSYTFEGMFWGCGCWVVSNPIEDNYAKPWLNKDLANVTCTDNNNSYVFWGKNAAFSKADFKWSLLQLVGKKRENIEGMHTLDLYTADEDDNDVLAATFTAAGYGSVKVNAGIELDPSAEEETDRYAGNPLNYIKSMSGYLVGTYNIVNTSATVGCFYCGAQVGCQPAPFCNYECSDTLVNKELAAVFGSWSLKYNSGLSNKVNSGKTITESYKFKDFVLALFAKKSL